VTQAAQELGIEIELIKQTDINAIMAAGVMITPAIAFDGEIKASGKLVDSETIKTWLQ
jgi:hypothetical protein